MAEPVRRRQESLDGDGGLRVGLYAAGVAVVVLGGLGALAATFHQPYLFPSVGPTVMVLAERPRSASAHPRSVVVGHVVGVLAGLLALLMFGLRNAPAVTVHGIGAARVGAVIVALCVTTLALQVLHAPHAPAGATAIIVSLGLLKSAEAMVAVVTAIAFAAVIATAINLATGKRQTLRLRRGSGAHTARDESHDAPPPGRHARPAMSASLRDSGGYERPRPYPH